MIIDMPTSARLPGLRQLWKEAFWDTDAFLDAFFASAFSPQRCRCVLENGEVAAALYWFDCLWEGCKVAYIYAVATAKAYRGRGLCRALMDQTHRQLTAQGYTGAVLVPGEKGLFQFYEAMGYSVCSTVSSFSCVPAAMPLQLDEIGRDEYARLRRSLLPAGGVVQEGENLDFLQTQARLYAGKGFVLAARGEGEALQAMELLGDASVAPGILAALGYETGYFRTPGAGADFAMYRSLDGSGAPAYFGLAFD